VITLDIYVPATGFFIWDIMLSFISVYIAVAVARQVIRWLLKFSF